MSNTTDIYLSSILSRSWDQTPPDLWQYQCVKQLDRTPYNDWSGGIVGRYGQNVTHLGLAAAWGIDIQTCFEFCDHRMIPFVFDFQSFSGSMTNYLLPWLALTAQLPFENGKPPNSIMSWLLAVGSPALATYSLSITILNRYSIRESFKRLRSRVANLGNDDRLEFDVRTRACQSLLEEGQQVPLRVSQKGLLRNLVASRENTEWWKALQARLKRSSRSITASLVAQMLFAAVAYLFTVISSFDSDLGDPTTALQIASGSLWIWLIPVILGWITVGTQGSHDSVDHALSADSIPGALEPRKQRAIRDRGGKDQRSANESSNFIRPHGAEGDEKLRGPIYNYARVFTWWQIWKLMDETISRELTDRETMLARRASDTTVIAKENTNVDSQHTAEQISTLTNEQTQNIPAYPKWQEIPRDAKMNMLKASLVALFLQWGTTGASIMIAYMTPTVGLGCRSASYIAYGCIGTAAWFCLVASMLLSHEVMLRCQGAYEPGTTVNETSHSWVRTLCFIVAGFLRLVGKVLASVNALWLITSSLLEITGGYDNCWCNGVYLGRHGKGFVVLFKTAAQLARAAKLSWGGGLAMTLIVCVVVYAFCFFWSRNDENN